MINIPISIGELIDKLSILSVKKTFIFDSNKLNYINTEFNLLYELSSDFLKNSEIEMLYHELIAINSKLWQIEDKIRNLEKNKNFGIEFIETSRSVYFTNDERFNIKNKINDLTNSGIKEIKHYQEYK